MSEKDQLGVRSMLGEGFRTKFSEVGENVTVRKKRTIADD